MKWKIVEFFLIISGIIWYNQLIVDLSKPTLIKLKIVHTINTDQIQNNNLSYSNLGILTPFTINSKTSPLTTSSWSTILPELKNGVSMAFDSNNFSDSQLVFITGHSSDNYPHAYSSIFAPLVSAKNGDTFSLKIENNIINYKVIETKIVLPTNIVEFENLKPKVGNRQRVALVTCYPVLTSQKRLVVLGEKVN